MRVEEVRQHERFPFVFRARIDDQERLATENLIPEVSVYGEDIFVYRGVHYRVWDPYRSKLAAAIHKGITELPIKPQATVLYLGAASGTTVSHVSDIVGGSGEVFAVEFSQRSIRDLIERVCRYRQNVQPILADARMPSTYGLIVSSVDTVYCDVAQPEQAKLLALNSEMFLRKGGKVMLAVKSRSVDVALAPAKVFDREIGTLKSRGFRILEAVRLEPFDRDHAMIIAESQE
jgi:fibrillarin-like pre-rRNA processing protein